jgi:hypothetical protein
MAGRKIITRAEAKAAGLKRYFTGTPCKRGHIAERFVNDRACTQCSLESVKQANRRAYAVNPEKFKEQTKRRRAGNIETMREKDNQRYAANREERRKKMRQHRAANLEIYRKRDRQKYEKQCCAKIVARVGQGLENAKASGMLMDIATAIEVFKADSNTFDFMATDA